MTGYAAEIIADSYSNESDVRLTTFVATYPRFVHSELMTHRMLSKNSSSSRAIPNSKLIATIQDDPVMPVWWGRNQRGMQAAEEISPSELKTASEIWIETRDYNLLAAERLSALGLHKQITNRIIEPWMFITVVITGTDFDNFFHLRTSQKTPLPQKDFDPDFPAQPEIQKIARMMWNLYRQMEPEVLITGEWHLPFVTLQERQALPIEICKRLSVARCARVSYLTHEGVYDIEKDKGLADFLSEAGHWSPFEHQAQALKDREQSGNFTGWKQYRKFWAGENFTR